MTARTSPASWGQAPTWLDDAERDGITPACRGEDVNLFFPRSRVATVVRQQVRQAKAICARCPLEGTCREWALEQSPQWLFGIWGGTTESERELLAVGRRRRNFPQAVDGEECAVD